jgi:predicted RNase H-like nuclease (RuvC/YqgF family)
MNAADNGPCNGDDRRLAPLFAEISALKEQRNHLQTQLAECRRANRELRAQLEERDQ